MSTKQIIMIAIGLLVVAALIGCSDDDCASCPEVVVPLGYTQGTIGLRAGTTMVALNVFSNGAVAPNLDSAKVGDSLVGPEGWWLSSNWSFGDAHSYIDFVESGDTSKFMYDPGDLATISIWGENRSSACHVKLLDPDLAMTYIIEPIPFGDTIVPGGSATVTWHKIENVDYYAVMIAWYTVPQDMYVFRYYYTVDTAFEITGTMQPAYTATEFNVHVTPFNGPDPRTGQSNWSGNLLDGVVFSFGTQNSTTIVIDQILANAKGVSPETMKALPEANAADIVTKVYEKYRK